MALDALLSTIILVSFLVTIIIAIGSYVAYKLRNARRPGRQPGAPVEAPFFERVRPEDLASGGGTDEAPWS